MRVAARVAEGWDHGASARVRVCVCVCVCACVCGRCTRGGMSTAHRASIGHASSATSGLNCSLNCFTRPKWRKPSVVACLRPQGTPQKQHWVPAASSAASDSSVTCLVCFSSSANRSRRSRYISTAGSAVARRRRSARVRKACWISVALRFLMARRVSCATSRAPFATSRRACSTSASAAS